MQYLKAMQALQGDPVTFVKMFFKAEPDAYQADVLNALARGDRGVSVKSSPGVGKTCVISWAAIWWISVFYSAKVAVTAPSSGQVDDAFMPEVKSWLKRMPEEIHDFYNPKSHRIEFTPYPELNFMSVKTSRVENPDAMQGVHAEHVLLIGDEASGIPEQVYEAASASSMANPHPCMLLTGNPVRSEGYFFDTFGRLSDSWTNFTITAADSERVTDEYVEECKLRYGIDSNTYRVRVLAEFPKGDDDVVIPLHLVQGAAEREVHPVGGVIWGLDVARFGYNKTALCKRRANTVLEPITRWAGLNTMEVVGRVQHEWQITPQDKRPADILVDSVGVGGGVADRLRQLGLPARDINVGEASSLKERYQYLRSELWYKAREWFEGLDVAIPPSDDVLRRELTTVRYRFLPSNKILVESKDDIKKRGIDSPDSADAFILTFAGNAVTAMRGRAHSRSKPIRRNIRGVV